MILLPRFLYPSPIYLILSLILAIILDFIYPYHKGFLYKIHPVHTSFVLSRKMFKPFSSKKYGFFIWFFVLSTHLLIYSLILYLSYKVNIIIWVFASSYILKTSISFKLLYEIVNNVKKSLEEKDINKARELVSNIVRRPTDNLDYSHIASAAIESLSESLVDSIISPLFWLILLGPIGSLMQRIINTLDGSLGFKDPMYKEVGYISAKADTIINYIPARISVMLFAISSIIMGKDVKSLFSCWKKYRKKTESLNAGNPMSAFAGAIKTSLEKINSYKLCDYDLPDSNKVDDSIKLALVSYFISIIISIITIYLI
jgi:adenosylcobinamide-phosphate synthase